MPLTPAVELEAAARAAGEDVGACLALAQATELPLPGHGATASRWDVLRQVSAANLTAGRVLEAHSDALAILAEAGEQPRSGSWGVFAAEAPDMAVRASNTTTSGWILEGTKPWCSLGGLLDHALVTAFVGDQRRLFAVDLQQPTVRALPAELWVSRGLRTVTSAPVQFSGAPARPVGEIGWYLLRPGFAWGGIGVAACWYGGALGLASALKHTAAQRASDLTDLALGTVDVALTAARCALEAAAAQIDGGAAYGRDGAVLALRVRSVVAAAVEQTVTWVGHALGPAPLAFDEEHARRVADLTVYIRQHHGERDLTDLGRELRHP